MKRTTILLLLFSCSLLSLAPVPKKNIPASQEYPGSYFRDPLGIPIQLAANFGEMRPNHFHMGFDIKTNQRENLPVYAAADGYVSRIKIEKSGFGQAIYINHPNGFTTLYAHLNDFYPALKSFIKNKQYAGQQWEQDIEFKDGQFPVIKGQLIAYSGNTGASQGPHLHFEIRDTKTGNNLNPWLFNFGLADKFPPSFYRLYVYDRRYSTYQAGPAAIPIKGANGKYTAINPVTVMSSPYISFGITADDRINAAGNRYGIYEAALSVDDTLRSDFQLNNISYTDTRYVNGSIDYKTRLSGGGYIQYLSRLPGNNSTIFSSSGDGTILLADSMVHTAVIEVKDANGNASVLTFKFRWDPSKTKQQVVGANTVTMVPGKENSFKTEDVEALFSDRAFYDTVPFLYKSEASRDVHVVSAIHHLHNYLVPVHDSFTVRIRPNAGLPDSLSDRVVMQMLSNHKEETVKGRWGNDFMEARFRDLGVFKLLLDITPPRVAPAGWVNGSNLKNRRSISFVAADNAGDIKTFNAYLDGQWLLFSRKNDSFMHTFDERTTAGPHELKVIVEDIAGNTTEKIFRFSR